MPINNPQLPGGAYDSFEVERKIAEVKSENKKDIERINGIMVGVVIFIAVTFIVEICTMNLDRIKDKDLYLQYNQLYKDYFDESLKSKENINQEILKINDLENRFELLKGKNPYLK